ncbi:MAG: HNH endonuclease [Actinomycetia bacterium]|nr:HNH endonuclease [Actinomycetes bacterium]
MQRTGSARNNVMCCPRDLPAIQEAYRRGLIAESNLRRLSATWGNERVRAKLAHSQFCEYLSDWERLGDEDGARRDDKHGEGNVTAGLFERTDTQRRMDALAAVFDKAASTPPGGTGPKFMLNVVIDWHTYQREVARLCGVDISPDDPNHQIDHLDPYNGTNKGRTDQTNSGPLCGKHNRLKHTAGFTTYRDNQGQWHVLRPDGTEIDP